ncbi:MAG: transcription-repair coupling factor [Lachnospiraceae bacterium]|nr:transcription-repair coupling factor [Lachnospiraceae bacterium]
METLYQPLLGLEAFANAKERLKKPGAFQLVGCKESQMVHFLSQLGREKKYQMVITYSEQRARELLSEYRFYDKHAYYYPAKDFIFMGADARGQLLLQERMQVFRSILEGEKTTVITTIDGLMDRLLPLHTLQENTLTFCVGEQMELTAYTKKLVQLGYEKTAQVEMPGQFAVRGSIVDIFPTTEEVPYRIDLFDDEIDLIKTFDPESQRSIENIEMFTLYPASEYVFTTQEIREGIERIQAEEKKCEAALRKEMKNEEAHRLSVEVKEFVTALEISVAGTNFDKFLPYFGNEFVSLLSYFPTEETVYFLDETARLAEKSETVEKEFRESVVHRLEKGYMLPKQAEVLVSGREVFAALEHEHTVACNLLGQKIKELSVAESFPVQVQSVNSYNSQFDMMAEDLKRYRRKGYSVVILSASRTRAARLAKNLQDFDIPAFYSESPDRVLQPREVMTAYGYIGKGFEYPQIKFVVIAETDIFPVEKKKKKKRQHAYSGTNIHDFAELTVGDYVIHENHGLGIYQGIEKIEVDRVTLDYIKISYSDGGNLYVKTTQLDRIQKYAGGDADGAKIKLNKLGGQEWHKTKSRVRTAVKNIANELIELYAIRQKQEGYQFGKDTVWQREFEEMFPFEETEDQLNAIEAMKQDMESKKMMDRLICGDVGYGKTEIAIRGAFKAVQEGKQVVMLVPTTILAQQHYTNFVQRFKDYPVRIEMLSRFRTPAQQKKTIAGLKSGYVDVVIGTHRVLSKDVAYKDLGLLIVDEEQRFGVTHKEKIKQLRKNIDVLTLTATPIPRTLHMSLIGIRDMSVLEEPPVDRLPIQTYVMEYNEEMVREAINRELARGGQVYYVYNRVNNIDMVAGEISKLVPDANVVYAHGQMSERQLERIMYDFIQGEIDVLVSTTIVETGLDIANANTMIIHDADTFGLSQLYQLRGRIGRSNRTAYAFMLYRRDKMLKEVAEKRLSAIREFTELGSGFKISMRDLELRGAGNLLGAEQHGHMEAVGYDLYCKMLNEAVLTAKGEARPLDFETNVEMSIDAYIPATYIKNESLKLDMYKKIAGMAHARDREEIEDELLDRFGEMPRPVRNLLSISELRTAAHAAGITEVRGNREEYRFYVHTGIPVVTERIPELIKKYNGEMRFKNEKEPYFHYIPRKAFQDEQARFEQMLTIITEIANLSKKE